MEKLKREGVIGISLIIALLILTYALVQASVVPFWDKEVEAEHIDVVYSDMMLLRSDIEDVAQHGTPKSSIVHLGVQYPNRILFFNPGPGAVGSITVENASITGSYTASGASTHPLNYNSSRIVYELKGMIHSPKLVYEHGIIIWDWGRDRIVTANSQSLINQDTGNVHIPVVAASPGTTSGLETELFEIYPYSNTSDPTRVESVTIKLDTDYPEVWCSLLKDSINAGLVSVCNQTKKIGISSSAFTYITLPDQPAAGAVSSGIITLSQELSPGAVLTIPTITTQNATAVDENNVTSTPTSTPTPTPEDDGRVVSGGGGGGGVIADKPPAVMTKNATNITALSAILNMAFDFNDYDTVQVQFRYKAEGASAWIETDWVSQSGSGSHLYSEPIARLSRNTTYYFMAMLQYDSTVLNGTELNFTTNRDLTPPAVSTKTATNLTALSAILNMGYDFNDYDTVQVQFRYKAEGASAWIETDWVSQSGSGSHLYSEPIARLSRNTTYYFMAMLQYDSTVLNGTELNFTTSGKLIPPTVSTKKATNVTAASAIVNMAFDFNDYTTVQVQFRYKAEGASAWNETGWVSQNGSGPHTYAEPIADLPCVTTYYFIAELKYGSTVIEGAEQLFTTYEQPTVRTKTATNVSDVAATLNMAFDFKDYSSVQVQFRYKAEGASAWNETGWVSPSGSNRYSESIANLCSNTTYYFTALLRYDGTAIEGVEKSFMTLEPPTVSTKNATQITHAGATLNMAFDLRDYTTVQVQFRYKAEGASAWNETGWVSPSGSNRYSEPIANLSHITTYYFKAQLRYGSTVIEGAEQSFMTLEPPAVHTKTATNVTDAAATLNMAFDHNDYGTVQVQFRYKAEGASGWNETGWVSQNGSGFHWYTEPIAGLSSSTVYHFKAQLRYDGRVIEGQERSFITVEKPTVSTKNAVVWRWERGWLANLKMDYDFKDYGFGYVRFAYKKVGDTGWDHTDWVGSSYSNTYEELIRALEGGTTYYFKAQLKYGDNNIIDGVILSFKTLEPR